MPQVSGQPRSITVETKPIAFIVACKQFFGFLPGQTLTDFKEEVQRLRRSTAPSTPRRAA